MWSSLPSNLRTVLGTALVLGIGVAVAAFTLSFFALKEAADNPALKFGQGHAWLFPIGVDMALLFFEVLLLAASMVRVQERGKIVQYPRAIPFLLMMVAAAGTLYFNTTRVPAPVRPIALAVPVASILVTLGLAYLLKMLAAASGAEATHLAPPALEPGRIVRRADVLQGEIVRGPDPSGPPGSPFAGYGAGTFPPQGAFGAMPSSSGPGTPQIGQAEVDEATKRRAAEMYLSGLTAEQLGVATGSSVVVGVAAQGIALDERYARRILDEYKAARKPANGGRTSVRRKA
jgi:hypothetical protein